MYSRLVVLESGLKSIIAGFGLGLGLEATSSRLGLDLDLVVVGLNINLVYSSGTRWFQESYEHNKRFQGVDPGIGVLIQKNM